MAWCYYDKKYPLLHYKFREMDGSSWYMFSIPVKNLVDVYRSYYGCLPGCFFDCGAAVGELLRQAEDQGIAATGIDIKRYPTNFPTMQKYEKYFASGQIQIKSILDCAPVRADLAYCNGTLTYMNEQTLPLALAKFKNVGMLIVIHNTTEDITAAREMGEQLLHREPRLIRTRQWWIDTFLQNGFHAEINHQINAFCLVPQKTK